MTDYEIITYAIHRKLGWEWFRDEPEKWNGKLLTAHWRRKLPNGEYEFSEHPPAYFDDMVALSAAKEVCSQRGMFWRAHSPAHWEEDDLDYWFGFTTIGFTGWNGRSEYEGHGETLALAICNAILELPKVKNANGNV